MYSFRIYNLIHKLPELNIESRMVVLTFQSVYTILKCDYANLNYSGELKVVPASESVDEILKCDREGLSLFSYF